MLASLLAKANTVLLRGSTLEAIFGAEGERVVDDLRPKSADRNSNKQAVVVTTPTRNETRYWCRSFIVLRTCFRLSVSDEDDKKDAIMRVC